MLWRPIPRPVSGAPAANLPPPTPPSDNFSVSSTVHSPKTAIGQRRLKLSQILTAANQLTLVRMAFLPFVVIKLVEGHYRGALILFLFAGLSDGLDGLLARTLHQ